MFPRIILCLLFAMIAGTTACRKRAKPAEVGTPAPTGPSPIVLPAGTRPPGAVAPAPSAVATQLNNALHSFLEMKGRMPHDIGELAAAKLVPAVPPPPPGRKYAIDANTLEVLLINQ